MTGDPLAVNRFTITKSLFVEGMLCVSAGGYGKFAKKAAIFLGCLWVVLLIVTLVLRSNLLFVIGEFVIIGLIILWLCVYMPRRNAKRAFKALQARCGSDMERETRFYEDHLEIEGSEIEKTIAYSKITDILTSKRLLVLVCDDKTGVLLSLEGFAVGDETIVCEFIDRSRAE